MFGLFRILRTPYGLIKSNKPRIKYTVERSTTVAVT